MDNKINIEALERVYTDPIPINGQVLVEVVTRDDTRKTKGGLIVSDEVAMGQRPTPLFVVKAIGKDIDNKYGIEIGDIIIPAERNITIISGKDMTKLALLQYTSISAYQKKTEGEGIPYMTEETQSTLITPQSRIIVDN